MTNPVDRGKYPGVKVISDDRLLALTLVITMILALVFILVPVGILYFYTQQLHQLPKRLRRVLTSFSVLKATAHC